MIALLLAWTALADSPLTTAEFSRAYEGHELVEHARETGELDDEIAEFLTRGKRGMDLKAAVINALSWNIEGQANAESYLAFLAERHDTPQPELLADIEEWKPQEQFAYGYLLALDDYFDPSPALPALALARERLPKSRTVALVEALTVGQTHMADDWCAVFTTVDAVLQDETLRPDMRFEGETVIADYIGLYEKSCPEEAPETDAPEEEGGSGSGDRAY